MEGRQVVLAGLTAIILFVFGLEHFSREIESITGDRFRKFLSSATRRPIAGVAIGAVVTGVIQSSSATSVITISLVNAGVLSFANSVGIIFGSNIGTTVTAQLVAFKVTEFAPFFVILGFVLSLIRSRYSVFGKAIFYFGFVFFALNLISSSLAPLQENAFILNYLTEPQNPLLAILIGCVFTALVQSSSVTTGLAIVFVQQGILGLENAVPLIMGANIGTTATALIAVFQMDMAAKKTALCHFLFNTGGVLLFTPLLLLYGHRLSEVTMEPAVALAMIHLVFNLLTTALFVVFIRQFIYVVDLFMGDGKMDFVLLEIPTFSSEQTYEDLRESMDQMINPLFGFLKENYNLVTLAIEANYQGITDAAAKRLDYPVFVKRETTNYFARVVSVMDQQEEVKSILQVITIYDYLFQIHDSIADLFETNRVINENYIDLQPDVLGLVRKVSITTLQLFDDVDAVRCGEQRDLKQTARAVNQEFDQVNRQLLKLIAESKREDAAVFSNFVTYSHRLKDKLINFCELSMENQPSKPVQLVK